MSKEQKTSIKELLADVLILQEEVLEQITADDQVNDPEAVKKHVNMAKQTVRLAKNILDLDVIAKKMTEDLNDRQQIDEQTDVKQQQ